MKLHNQFIRTSHVQSTYSNTNMYPGKNVWQLKMEWHAEMKGEKSEKKGFLINMTFLSFFIFFIFFTFLFFPSKSNKGCPPITSYS